MSVPILRVSSLEQLKAFFGDEPRIVHPAGWTMGATFVVREESEVGGYLEVMVALDDVELTVTALSRGSSEMTLRVTDVTSWQLVGDPASQKLVVAGSQTGIREVTIGLRPTKIDVSLDW